MTDKQIIKQFSDGYCLVLEDDVVTLREDEFTKYRIVLGSKTNELLKFVKDTYLQLKAKEQECERLKEERDTWHFQWEKRYEICECLSDDIDKLCEQLDQLKAENEKYQLFIEKLCDYTGLECDNEEQAMRTLSDFASQMNKARWRIDRYKQTLTEIKEIAEDFYLDGEKVKDKYLAQDILQKISEVEND